MTSEASLQWLGRTCFRIIAHGIHIFLDCPLARWEEAQLLKLESIDKADYIFVCHAHFDHLPGAEKIALKTGAIILGNAEVIRVMKDAGVPAEQLIMVAGGERLPLYTREQRQQGAPAAEAKASVHVWPSCHQYGIPGDITTWPLVGDTDTEYYGHDAGPFACAMEVSQNLERTLKQLGRPSSLGSDAKPSSAGRSFGELPPEYVSFVQFLKDDANHFSAWDGGQLMYNILLGDQTVLWNSVLGAYSGILKNLDPRPDVAIMGVAGRGNVDGKPFEGSAAQLLSQCVKWVGEPARVVWCLQDEFPVPPKTVKTDAATRAVEEETESKIWELEHAQVYTL